MRLRAFAMFVAFACLPLVATASDPSCSLLIEPKCRRGSLPGHLFAPTFVECLRSGAAADDPLARVLLGSALMFGWGVEPDPSAAVEQWQAARPLPGPEPELSLGVALAYGLGCRRDADAACALLDQAVAEAWAPQPNDTKESLPLLAEPEFQRVMLELEGPATISLDLRLVSWVQLASSYPALYCQRQCSAEDDYSVAPLWRESALPRLKAVPVVDHLLERLHLSPAVEAAVPVPPGTRVEIDQRLVQRLAALGTGSRHLEAGLQATIFADLARPAGLRRDDLYDLFWPYRDACMARVNAACVWAERGFGHQRPKLEVHESVEQFGDSVRVRELLARSWYEGEHEDRGLRWAHRVYARHPSGGWQVLGPAEDWEMALFARLPRLLGTDGDPVDSESEERVDLGAPTGPYIFATVSYSAPGGMHPISNTSRLTWDARTGQLVKLTQLIGPEAQADLVQAAWEQVLGETGVPFGDEGWVADLQHQVFLDRGFFRVGAEKLMVTLSAEMRWYPFGTEWHREVTIPLPEPLRRELGEEVCSGAFGRSSILRSELFDPDRSAREDVAEGETALALGDRERALRWWREALAFWTGGTDPAAVLADPSAPEAARALAKRMASPSSE